MAKDTQGANIVEKVMELVQPVVDQMSIELYDIEFVKEGTQWYLRLYIDKDGGVDLQDCENVSRHLEKLLDAQDFIEQAYILEVSSPGINRKLKQEKDFIRYIGEIVDVKLYQPKDKRKEFQGILKAYDHGTVTIQEEGELVYTFEPEEIAVVRLAVFF